MRGEPPSPLFADGLVSHPLNPLQNGFIAHPVVETFHQQKQGNSGFAGHGSDVSDMTVPRSAQATKNPSIADGVYVRFGREIDSDNHNAPCFSPKGFVWLSVRRPQASRQNIN